MLLATIISISLYTTENEIIIRMELGPQTGSHTIVIVTASIDEQA